MKNRTIRTILYTGCLAAGWLCLAARAAADDVVTRTPSGLRVENASAERADGHLVVSLTMRFDSVTVPANRLMAVTPVIRGRDGEEEVLPAVLLAGRRQHYVYLREGNRDYPGAQELRRANGTAQSVDYLRAVPFRDWMRHATVSLFLDSCGCGLNLARSECDLLSLRDPSEALKRLAVAYVTPRVQEGKTYTLEGRAFLDFPVNRTEIHPDYRNNPRELGKIVETIDVVRNDTNATITAVSIHGYASPEGPYANNVRLSIGRAAALRDYVRNLYRFGDEVRFDVKNTPEDWDGLDSLVRTSNLEMKDELLALIRTEMDADAKDNAIKRRWPDTYRFILAAWYPALRHSDYVVAYSVRQFTTPEEAKRVYLEKPQQLSLHELFMVAGTYEPGSAAYNEVFETAVRLYPDDPVANLNAANIAIGQRDLDRAEGYLAKAGDAPEAKNARGAVALLRGDYAAARTLLEQARAEGVEAAAANLGILEEVE